MKQHLLTCLTAIICACVIALSITHTPTSGTPIIPNPAPDTSVSVGENFAIIGYGNQFKTITFETFTTTHRTPVFPSIPGEDEYIISEESTTNIGSVMNYTISPKKTDPSE